MTYSDAAYAPRALDRAFPRYYPHAVREQQKALAQSKPKKVKRDWLLVASNPLVGHRIMISEIQRAVCEHYSISHTDLISERRLGCLARARHVSVWLCHKLTGRSITYIALRHGNRHYTTCMNSIDRISRLLREDRRFVAELNALRSQIEVANYDLV